MEILELEKLIATEDTLTLHVKIPVSLYWHYKTFFDVMSGFAEEMRRKERVASMQAQYKREEYEKRLRTEWNTVKDGMRAFYQEKLGLTSSHREALKAVTRQYRLYWWLRAELQKEIQARWELEAPLLISQGLSSKDIATQFGISMASVKKIMLNYK